MNTLQFNTRQQAHDEMWRLYREERITMSLEQTDDGWCLTQPDNSVVPASNRWEGSGQRLANC